MVCCRSALTKTLLLAEISPITSPLMDPCLWWFFGGAAVVSTLIYVKLVTKKRNLPVEPLDFSENRGTRIRLSEGYTNYVLRGNPSKQHLVVFVNGLLSSLYSMEHLEIELSSLGYAVLNFDLWGRGHSDGPKDVDYTEDLYVSQLAQLLFALDAKQKPVTLIGVSLGGAISATFASRYPQHVKDLILCGPAGLPVHESLTKRISELPIVGEIIPSSIIRHSLIQFGFTSLAEGKQSPHYKAMADNLEVMISQMDYNPSFWPAVLSTVRHFNLSKMESTYASLPCPVLVLWGRHDAVCPYRNVIHMTSLLGENGSIVTIENAGHALFVENRADTVGEIRKYLAR